MARVDELQQGDEHEEKTLAELLQVSRTPEGRASLSDELRDVLHLLPVSPPRLLLLRLRLLRNLLAGDERNQTAFVHLSGPAVVASVLSFPDAAVARAALQALGNAALAGEYHRAAVWEALFPGALREFAGIKDAGVLDPLCMVLDTCCSGEGGRGRIEELCRDHSGLPILVQVVTTASKVDHKEEWIEWFLFKVCVEEKKFKTLFRALCSTDDVECNDSVEYNANHSFILGTLSKYLTSHPKEVTVPDSFTLDAFNVHKNSVDTVDFTRRGSSPLPTGNPAIDVLGYTLQLLRDICSWESSSLETQLPVDSLLQTGLVKHLLKYLCELEPPSTIRKSMAIEQGGQQPSFSNGKVCPYIGYRRDLVAIIANCLHRRKQVQDEVRKLNGIMLLLQQCVIDEENPYMREWGLLAVKNMLEDNEENQKEVSELELRKPVITPEVADIGLKVEIDEETGRPKLVNTP